MNHTYTALLSRKESRGQTLRQCSSSKPTGPFIWLWLKKKGYQNGTQVSRKMGYPKPAVCPCCLILSHSHSFADSSFSKVGEDDVRLVAVDLSEPRCWLLRCDIWSGGWGSMGEEGGARSSTRSPSSALSPTFFGWEGSPTKINYGKKGYPYSNLSTGGPSQLNLLESNTCLLFGRDRVDASQLGSWSFEQKYQLLKGADTE